MKYVNHFFAHLFAFHASLHEPENVRSVTQSMWVVVVSIVIGTLVALCVYTAGVTLSAMSLSEPSESSVVMKHTNLTRADIRAVIDIYNGRVKKYEGIRLEGENVMDPAL